MKKLFSLIAAVMLVGAGCTTQTSVDTTVQQPTSTVQQQTGGQGSNTAAGGTGTSLTTLYNSLGVGAQSPGMRVTLDSVVFVKPGFVVIHEDVNGKVGKVLGVSVLLSAGQTEGASVPVSLKTGTSYWAVLHVDDGDGMFTESKDVIAKDAAGNDAASKFTVNGSATGSTGAGASGSAGTGVDVNANVGGVGGSVKATALIQAKIQSFAYSPMKIVATKGDKVVFTNQDSVGHTVTADDGAFDSGMISQGNAYSLDTSTLAKGTYSFHCKPHPYMKGTLVVQ